MKADSKNIYYYTRRAVMPEGKSGHGVRALYTEPADYRLRVKEFPAKSARFTV